MLGSTIIFEPDVRRFAKLTEMDDLESFDCLHLDDMLTLDFEELLEGAELDWAQAGDPVKLDEQSGMVLFGVNPDALKHVLKQSHQVETHQVADLEKLSGWLEGRGLENIYELSNF